VALVVEHAPGPVAVGDAMFGGAAAQPQGRVGSALAGSFDEGDLAVEPFIGFRRGGRRVRIEVGVDSAFLRGMYERWGYQYTGEVIPNDNAPTLLVMNRGLTARTRFSCARIGDS